MSVKRASLLTLAVVILAVLLAATACSPSPKAQVDEFVEYMPEEIGAWELDESVQLQSNTVTSIGHAAFTYEGPDDEIAFIIIEAHPSEDAADVAAAARERELLLRGLELDTDSVPRQARAQVAQDERVRYALFSEGKVTVEIDALSPEAGVPVSDELFDELLSLVRAIYARTADD